MPFRFLRVPAAPCARRRSVAPARLLLASALLIGACGGGSNDSARARNATPDSATRAGSSVAIETFMFMPKVLKVKVGEAVTWTNKDSILHTITSGTREYAPGDSGRVTATHKDGMFDMQLDGKGAMATFTFNRAGSFHYFCDRHPGMEADIEAS